MYAVITMNKATNKILEVELYSVESKECYEEMQEGADDIKSQGFKCEIHRII